MAIFFETQLVSRWTNVAAVSVLKVFHRRSVPAVALSKNVAKFFWLRKPRVKRENWWVKCSSIAKSCLTRHPADDNTSHHQIDQRVSQLWFAIANAVDLTTSRIETE
jgi:hypothetical protein